MGLKISTDFFEGLDKQNRYFDNLTADSDIDCKFGNFVDKSKKVAIARNSENQNFGISNSQADYFLFECYIDFDYFLSKIKLRYIENCIVNRDCVSLF